ncbi:helix-turn-helix transcriptional regulator [Streptomyces sp. XC 2026]|nr:helix-turn-helix transcriptional regulator [Streptomyces sp. XC 2026]
MDWSTQAIQGAARSGDFGRVVRLARTKAGMSQRQLGEACGISQSAVSRWESHGNGSYDMTVLARVAAHLGIPSRFVGLADRAVVPPLPGDGAGVDRRNLLAAGAVVAAAPALTALGAGRAMSDDGQATVLRLATNAFRRMDGTTSSRHLIEPTLAHLRLTQTIAAEAEADADRSFLAAAGSEVAGLAGWLSWDMGDLGSARRWYGAGISGARRSGNRMLTAYQLGSLAQLEASVGNSAQGMKHLSTARRLLGRERPAIVDAWLLTVEALTHAEAGSPSSADKALRAASEAVGHIPMEEPPPWPWVFTFDRSKVAACRLSCGARLGIAEWVKEAQGAATAALASGHDKQRALLVLDLARGHLASGRIDTAFALGAKALETGLRYRSGRVVEQARSLRRAYTSGTPAKIVRDFDERLHGVYL